MKKYPIFFILYLFCLLHTNITAQTTTVSGNVLTPDEEIATNVTVSLSGTDFSQMVAVDELGNYEFTNVPTNQELTIVARKADNFLNGVSTLDVVLSGRHILGLAVFDSPHKYISMDVNRSGHITAFDLVQQNRLILGITETFPDNTAWRIVLTEQLNDINIDPVEEDRFAPLSPVFTTTIDPMILNFTAIKIGDCNGNAIP